MDRNDWVFVGTRLGGLFLVCRSTLRIPAVLEFHRQTHHEGLLYGLSAGGLAEAVLGWILGVLLFFGAPAVARWLAGKDAGLAP